MNSDHSHSSVIRPGRPGRWRHRLGLALAATGTCLGPLSVVADDPRLDKLEKENLELRQRLAKPSRTSPRRRASSPAATPPPKFVSALSEITLSGFVQASYFYNTQDPADKASDGYLWNTIHDSFSINKVKLTLASKPSERSGELWDAGFRASMIWGDDAPSSTPAANARASRRSAKPTSTSTSPSAKA
jgi:hypothetical protein